MMVDFREKFNIPELTMFETEYWIWSLRPHQATIGAGILSLKRECASFSDLNPEEHCDLNTIIKVIEKTLKNVFEYDIMNYLMLMMVDKQVHYHVIPRYEHPVEAFNEIWHDSAWPGLPNLAGVKLEASKLTSISMLIKNQIIS
ncbi:HIT family protein [Bacillus spongiae]|uniref:HIT family protein n=1 Tax=Bacillus spongiae TaxID=2683610 RepID=A0ABU8HDY6_9BACI